MAKIIELLIDSEDKKTIKVDSITLIKDVGIVGNRHSGGNRQVSLFPYEGYLAHKNERQGLCAQRYHTNLYIEGLDFRLLKIGTKLQVGSTKLIISERKHECYDDCPKHLNREFCSLMAYGLYARVIEDGIINLDDKVEVIL